MNNDPRLIMPGDRVLAFDMELFVDDATTPQSYTMRPATVLRRYGKRVLFPASEAYYTYNDLVDINFDHRGESKGHFTNSVQDI